VLWMTEEGRGGSASFSKHHRAGLSIISTYPQTTLLDHDGIYIGSDLLNMLSEDQR